MLSERGSGAKRSLAKPIILPLPDDFGAFSSGTKLYNSSARMANPFQDIWLSCLLYISNPKLRACYHKSAWCPCVFSQDPQTTGQALTCSYESRALSQGYCSIVQDLNCKIQVPWSLARGSLMKERSSIALLEPFVCKGADSLCTRCLQLI